MSKSPVRFVKCRVCGEGMRETVADSHLQTHIDASDLIRAAHHQEITEMKEQS